MATPAPLSALWTTYEPEPDQKPEHCITCGEEVLPGTKKVRVHAAGLEHHHCWWGKRLGPREAL